MSAVNLIINGVNKTDAATRAAERNIKGLGQAVGRIKGLLGLEVLRRGAQAIGESIRTVLSEYEKGVKLVSDEDYQRLKDVSGFLAEWKKQAAGVVGGMVAFWAKAFGNNGPTATQLAFEKNAKAEREARDKLRAIREKELDLATQIAHKEEEVAKLKSGLSRAGNATLNQEKLKIKNLEDEIVALREQQTKEAAEGTKRLVQESALRQEAFDAEEAAAKEIADMRAEDLTIAQQIAAKEKELSDLRRLNMALGNNTNEALRDQMKLEKEIKDLRAKQLEIKRKDIASRGKAAIENRISRGNIVIAEAEARAESLREESGKMRSSASRRSGRMAGSSGMAGRTDWVARSLSGRTVEELTGLATGDMGGLRGAARAEREADKNERYMQRLTKQAEAKRARNAYLGREETFGMTKRQRAALAASDLGKAQKEKDRQIKEAEEKARKEREKVASDVEKIREKVDSAIGMGA